MCFSVIRCFYNLLTKRRFSLQRPWFNSSSCGIYGGKGDTEQIFVRLFQFPLPFIIAPVLGTHLSSSAGASTLGPFVPRVPRDIYHQCSELIYCHHQELIHWAHLCPKYTYHPTPFVFKRQRNFVLIY
jgi:hypothetical protein